MKKYSLAFTFLFVSILLAFFSCKKINEATELGGNLIPAVDNIHTFETSLDVFSKNAIMSDTTRVDYSDLVALGDVNDPVFGHTHANFGFSIVPALIGTFPFQDSVKTIDSVVLQLAYEQAYGDTVGNGMQSVRVYEIDPNSGFRYDSVYRFNDATTENFRGQELTYNHQPVTYNIRQLADTFSVIRPGDTVRTANAVRIRLDPSLAARFRSYDTTSSPVTGAYHDDSLFMTIFKGLYITSDNTGQALSYFNLGDTKTKLTVYYKHQLNGVDTTASLDFFHTYNGQVNYVQVTPANEWATALGNSGNAASIYLQGAPSGSYASLYIKGLDTMTNKVIHRAELVISKVPSASDNVFTPPVQLLLDHVNGAHDSTFLLENDLVAGSDGSIGFSNFGGGLLSDNTYRLNVTRYVQAKITRNLPNDSLRLYTVLRKTLFARNLNTYISVPGAGHIYAGRLKAGGGASADPNTRLRLRIIYSNL